ncbi:MAG: glycosyltransferase family 9 protein [Sulfuritalea sp.]|nr:glycosyltransferase family 9 protein [Sulfuritalea sp.]
MGDEIMVTGHARELQMKDPRKVRLDYGGKKVWNEIFNHNPRIARYDEEGDFQIYQARLNGVRPYATAKTIDRWTWCEYKPPIGEIYFQPEELKFAARHDPHVVIEPNVKGGASPNKDWGLDRWTHLVQMLRAAGLRPVQFGQRGTRRVPGTDFIETPTFRLAAAVLARARAAVLHEGGLHHAAAAVGVRAVVIYGGYISPQQTGYDMHANLFTGRKPCGMRIPCRHCKRAMQDIPPDMVMGALKRLLDETSQRACAASTA